MVCESCSGHLKDNKLHLSRQNRFKKYQELSSFRFRKEDINKTGLELFFDSIDWLNLFILSSVIIVSIYGMCTTHLQYKTFLLSIFWYILSGLGITAGIVFIKNNHLILNFQGYHRCFSHRAFKSSSSLKIFFLIWGSAAAQGSAKWYLIGFNIF